jgi:penicillin amidase
MPGYFQPLDRAGRIEAMLEEQPTWKLDDMKRMQYDDFAYTGDEMRAIILAALDPRHAELDALEKNALEHLRTWDLRHDIHSIGATIYWSYFEYIVKEWAQDEFGSEKAVAIYDSLADSFNGFKLAMRKPELPGWDNINTPEKETQQDTLLAAFKRTVSVLREEYGGNVNTWTWGEAHTMEFSHPLGYLPGLNQIFNVGPFPSTGSQQVVNNMLFSPNDARYKVLAGPSTRRVIDFAKPDDSYSIIPTGNSGHFLSPHYDDQAPLFMTGKYRKLNFTKEQVDANTENTLTFSK